MSEVVSVTPETVADSLEFQIGNQGFRVGGELTDGRYTGEIELPDGRSFTGIVEKRTDGGWKVENWDSGESFESPATEIAEAALPESQVDSAVNLENATVLAAVDSVAQIQEPQPAAVEVPEIAVMEVSAPVAVPVAEADSAGEDIPTAPEPVVVERVSGESRRPSTTELQQKMQRVYKPLRAARLWKQAEGIREEIASGKGGVKAKKELMAKMDALRDQARDLHPGIEKMAQDKRSELSKTSVPLSAEGSAEAIKMANLRHREDAAVQYEQELQKWEDVLNNPAGFEEYRNKAAEIEAKRAAARKLYSDEDESKLLDQALARVDQKGNKQLTGLRNKLPQRLLELAGFAGEERSSSSIMRQLENAESDVDLRMAYNRVAQQLYAELMGLGLPQAVVQPEIPVAEPALPEEEVPLPVIEETQEQVAEILPVDVATGAQPVVEVAETIAAPVAEETPVPVPLTGAPVEEAAPETLNFGTSEDELEKERAKQRANLASTAVPATPVAPAVGVAGKTGTVAGDAQKGIGQFAEGLNASFEEKAKEYADRISAGEDPKTMGVPDALRARVSELVAQTQTEVPEAVQPEAAVELSVANPENPDQRLERRKQGFSEAFAKLELARKDENGTEEEQMIRLAESFNQVIGAGIELMREGDAAKEVVKEFLRVALGTSSGEKLTEVSVKSRLGDAGVLGAMTPEDRKKKLEEAGLLGFLELLIEMGMGFADKTIETIVGEVQSATGGRG
jgi:hypothetical protein